MGAEAARVLDYDSRYTFGSAAPAAEVFPQVAPRPLETPGTAERIRQREKERAEAAERKKALISPFAAVGSLFVALLLVLVVLAQVNYYEAAAESVRLNAQMVQLMEQHRALTIAFESVIDMKEVEQYARDVLGMSRPENYQMALIQSTAGDKAEVLIAGEADSLRNFGSFISSLLEYFK